MSEALQEISALVTRQIRVDFLKALLYSEVEDGVISADLFFLAKDRDVVTFRFANRPLKDSIYALWQHEPHRWAVLALVLDETRFSADFTYPNELVRTEATSDRRPRAVAEAFPGLRIDYSRPS